MNNIKDKVEFLFVPGKCIELSFFLIYPTLENPTCVCRSIALSSSHILASILFLTISLIGWRAVSDHTCLLQPRSPDNSSRNKSRPGWRGTEKLRFDKSIGAIKLKHIVPQEPWTLTRETHDASLSRRLDQVMSPCSCFFRAFCHSHAFALVSKCKCL